jgi:hypothetical protein
MTKLRGEKIESLLWENGFEFQHRLPLEGSFEVEVFADSFSIVLGEVWIEDGDWMLDGLSSYFQCVQGGEVFDMGYLEDAHSESDLVARIVELGER